MRLLPSLFVAALVVLSGCDATAPSEQAAASSDQIVAAHASASMSSSCTAPTLSFGSTSGVVKVVATPANPSSDVSVSIEETVTGGGGWSPVHGESYNGSAVTYNTDWAHAEGRPYYFGSYRARTLCSNGFISGYSNTIQTGIDL